MLEVKPDNHTVYPLRTAKQPRRENLNQRPPTLLQRTRHLPQKVLLLCQTLQPSGEPGDIRRRPRN